jgi:hypothetical protein
LAAAVPIKPSEKMVLAVRSKEGRRERPRRNVGVCRSVQSVSWPGGNNAALASDKQIALVQRFIDEGKITAPPGYPDAISGADAPKIIEKLFAETKRNKRSRGKRDCRFTWPLLTVSDRRISDQKLATDKSVLAMSLTQNVYIPGLF